MKKYLKLKYYRAKLGISREAFAKLLGCGVSNYTQKENGKVRFLIDDVFVIIQAINEREEKLGLEKSTFEEIFFD